MPGAVRTERKGRCRCPEGGEYAYLPAAVVLGLGGQGALGMFGSGFPSTASNASSGGDVGGRDTVYQYDVMGDDEGEVSGVWDVIGSAISSGSDVLVSREQRKAIRAGGDAASVTAMRRPSAGGPGSVGSFQFQGGMGPLLLIGGLALLILLRR